MLRYVKHYYTDKTNLLHDLAKRDIIEYKTENVIFLKDGIIWAKTPSGRLIKNYKIFMNNKFYYLEKVEL